MISATAPGKIIISGEHSVVYGYPALIASLNLYLTATLKNSSLDIKSSIPIGCGLGSSAALAAVKAALILKKLDLNRINQMTFNQERKFHYQPSGADNSAVVYGGWLKFQKPKSITHFKKLNFPQVVLINTGRPTETTAQMVKFVKLQSHSSLKAISACTNAIIKLLKTYRQPDFNQLKSLIHQNELLLEQLGVVSPSTQKIIRRLEQSRGVAKICGAGGRITHSGILLCLHHRPQTLVKLAQTLKLNYFYPVRLGVPGISLHTQSPPPVQKSATS